MADRVEAVMLEKVGYLAKNPGAGHGRKDLTAAQVRVFPSVFVFDRLPTREASAGSRLDSSWATGRGDGAEGAEIGG